MRNTLETRLGIFAALTVIVFVVILEIIGGLDLFQKSYRVHALFKNVQDLKVGDPVKMAGVPIGRVDALTLTNNQVQVTLKLNKEAIVRTDSKAAIKFAGLMGQNYVAVNFGTENGLRLDPEKFLQTVEQADMGELMERLNNVAGGIESVTKSFSGDTINNLLGPFTDFLKQNREPLSLSISNLETISSQIAQGKGTVGRLIKEDTLHNTALSTLTNFEATAVEVRSGLADAREVLANARTITTNVNLVLSNANHAVVQVNSGQGTVGKLLNDDKLYTEATEAMVNLREVSQKINRGQGSVGRLINDESLFKNAKLTLQKLDKATEGLEDQGPLSVLGMAVGTLF